MGTMIGFWIFIGLVVACWLVITVGIHDADPRAPFREIAAWFRHRRRIRQATKLKKSWLANWPEVRRYTDYMREQGFVPKPGELDPRTLRRQAKRFPFALDRWDYTGRLHELKEDGFEASSPEYTSARELFARIAAEAPFAAHCDRASRAEVPPYVSFLLQWPPIALAPNTIWPWSPEPIRLEHGDAHYDPAGHQYWQHRSVSHVPRPIKPYLVLNGHRQGAADAEYRRSRVLRYFDKNPTVKSTVWTGKVDDRACVDLQQPGLGKALTAQVPKPVLRSWNQMLGRLDRKRAPWYRRARLVLVHLWARARRSDVGERVFRMLKRRHLSIQSVGFGFAVGDGPVKISGMPGTYYVTAIHGNELQLERPRLIARAWRWATGPVRRWLTRRALVREFKTYPGSGNDSIDALSYGLAWHRHVERNARKRWYHRFTKGSRK